VYGDESANGYILKDQYLWDPAESFDAGKGYLIKARPADYPYSELIDAGGLTVTDGDPDLYTKGQFLFDGNIYSMQSNFKEQLFADNTLFTQTFSSVTPSATINWVIGNSWTSAIAVDSLVNLINTSDLYFEPCIYVWLPGQTTYQQYDKPWNPSSVGTIDNLFSIPSQTLFMIRVLQGYSQNGTFSLDKRIMQTHSTASHNTLRASASGFHNEILFKVSPESNPNIYDLTAVGLRPDAKEAGDNQDKSKMYQENSSTFLLYSLSTDNKKLSVNVVPEETHSVKLCLHPGSHGGVMTLTASRIESIAKAWLEDLLTNQIIDLTQQDTYTFTASPQDTPERFIVHFSNAPTGMDEIRENFLQCYYSQGEIVVNGLKDADLRSSLSIIDLQGRTVYRGAITQAPEMRFALTLPDGIYLVRLHGNRTVTVKFRKGGNL
jgi:hypothetical protein